MPADTVELVIDRLGAQGDGVATMNDRPIHIPFGLPGERVRARLDAAGRATLIDVLRPSPARVAAPCPHFGVCGGCKTQHLNTEAYLDWRNAQVRTAFAARGLDVPIAPVVTFPLARRRRAVLTARRGAEGLVAGFHTARGHDIVAISQCPVLMPEIERALPALSRLAALLLTRRGDIKLTVLCADNGLDIAIEGAEWTLSPGASEQLAALASAMKVTRLSLGGDTVFSTADPAVHFGPATVTPPPGAFLQAMAEAETAISGLIQTAFAKSKRVADLFCGLGAFTFPLAMHAEVLAVDSDASAIRALQVAARRTAGLKPITSKTRDLFRTPLSATELKDFDAVVFDPPRAGAKAQAEAIARSKAPAVVAVSCDMGTLARDARTLVDGGYRLSSVTPIDQFRYSTHIEAVAVFRR